MAATPKELRRRSPKGTCARRQQSGQQRLDLQPWLYGHCTSVLEQDAHEWPSRALGRLCPGASEHGGPLRSGKAADVGLQPIGALCTSLGHVPELPGEMSEVMKRRF